MKLKIGSPVSGSNFYPRKDVIFRLRKALDRDHVSFLAPRRTGKTSILMHMEETAPEDHPHFFVNLETCTSPAEMMSALLNALSEGNPKWKKALGGLQTKVTESLGAIDSVTIAGTGIGLRKGTKDWKQPAEALLRQLLAHEGRITFLLDEFPILVDAVAKEDREECEAMLRWFREWRQRTANTHIRFLVTGSIGLTNVVRRHGLADTVNDFDFVDLPPLSRAEAVKFLAKLAAGTGLVVETVHAEHILNLVGNAYPYFLQIFMAEIDDACPPQDGKIASIDADLIDSIYRTRIVAGPRNKYLPHMWDRLGETFSQSEIQIARAILRAVSKQAGGLSTEQIYGAARSSVSQSTSVDDATIEYVLDVLKHDAYLLQDAEPPHRTRFFSNLLLDYWIRRHA